MSGSLAIIGLGPGDDRYLTREAEEALAGAEALYGYGPYLGRVPVTEGQARHASDNREEGARAKAALNHAAAGRPCRHRFGRRSWRVRHGGFGLRGDRGGTRGLARARGQDRAGDHRHACRGGTRGRSARS